MRLYKKGTAHLEINPEMAAKLNQVLTFLHPNAIPAEFRRKPVKEQRSKNHILEHDLVSFDAQSSIESCRMTNDGYESRMERGVCQ